MNVVQPGQAPIAFISSTETKSEQGLLTVHYRRVQQISPEYISLYDGIDQHVDVKIATLVFRAAPEPLISFYEFIMTTFVPSNATPGLQTTPEASQGVVTAVSPQANGQDDSGRIRVLLQLDSVQGMFDIF